MESWNNLQTCFACLWQKWKDYFKFCGNVNKQDSIDVIGIAPSVSAHILTWFSFLSSEETTFAMPPWRLHDGYSRDLLRRNRSGAIYQVLNEKPTLPSHRETWLLTPGAQQLLVCFWREEVHTLCLQIKF